jgi:hypothetical protein
MRIVLLAACLGLGMLPVVIQPTSAMQPCALIACTSPGQNNGGGGIHGAPAPVIGAGLPALLGFGGAWTQAFEAAEAPTGLRAGYVDL